MKTKDAFSFLKDTYERLKVAPKNDIRLHRNEAKELLEEQFPIALLAYQIDRLAQDVSVEYFGPNHPLGDALIRRDGREFPIEVTFCRTYEDSLRSEQMVKEGSAPAAGPIQRDPNTKEVVSEMQAIDIGENVQKLISEIQACIAAKALKHYPENTILIVAFEHGSATGIEFWQELAHSLRNTSKGSFRAVYLCNIISKQIIHFL